MAMDDGGNVLHVGGRMQMQDEETNILQSRALAPAGRSMAAVRGGLPQAFVAAHEWKTPRPEVPPQEDNQAQPGIHVLRRESLKP